MRVLLWTTMAAGLALACGRVNPEPAQSPRVPVAAPAPRLAGKPDVLDISGGPEGVLAPDVPTPFRLRLRAVEPFERARVELRGVGGVRVLGQAVRTQGAGRELLEYFDVSVAPGAAGYLVAEVETESGGGTVRGTRSFAVRAPDGVFRVQTLGQPSVDSTGQPVEVLRGTR